MLLVIDKFTLSLVIFSFLCCQHMISQSVATYSLTFTSTWNSLDHGTLPSNAHWSNLVGATHNSNISFWELNALATPGIEDMAERGVNDNLFDEVNTAILANNADQWLEQPFNPNNENGIATLMNVQVSEDFPLLTLTSMIAPSPDWFIGVNSLTLLDGTDNWINSIVMDMFTYDAGTEDGATYSTNNNPTSPLENITSLINVPPFNDKKVGTLTITLQSVLNIPDDAFLDQIFISPNPSNGNIRIINSSNNPITEVNIYNSMGTFVHQLEASSNQVLDFSNLSSGLYYFILIMENGHLINKKILIDP